MEQTTPFIVVGLGNPGSKYDRTRHNLGFDVVDLLAQRLKAPPSTNKFHAEFFQGQLGQHKVFLLKPQTYMNRSGLSVGEITTFYKVPVGERLIVVSDDLDLPEGALRIRLSGGPGGHNGLKSIIDAVGSQGFPRVRIGIGRSQEHPADVYVLMKIPSKHKALYEEAVTTAAEAVEAMIEHGFPIAMNRFNRKEAEK